MKEELIDFAIRFMDRTTRYGDFRSGGNLGRIMQGQLEKEGLDNLAKAVNRLSDVLEKRPTTLTSEQE